MSNGTSIFGEYFNFVRGNKKLGRDTLIFNMGTAIDCPSAKLGLCPHVQKCYARKAEIMYKTVIPFRQAQHFQWEHYASCCFIQDVKNILQRAYKPIKYLRVSEAGDFESQNDVNKLSEIAYNLTDTIKVYTYTARRDLDFTKKSDKLVVNGSGFMIDNKIVVSKNPEPKIGEHLCPGNCRKCNACKVANHKTIHIPLH